MIDIEGLRANQVNWVCELKKIAAVPVVQVCAQGVIGICGDCNSGVEGTYTTPMLPDGHPGKKLDPPLPISFVRTDFKVTENNSIEVDKTSLVCMSCALKLNEVCGYWSPKP